MGAHGKDHAGHLHLGDKPGPWRPTLAVMRQLTEQPVGQVTQQVTQLATRAALQHATRIPPEYTYLILAPWRITAAGIEKERNAEMRRVTTERYGAIRYFIDSEAAVVEEPPADHRITGSSACGRRDCVERTRKAAVASRLSLWIFSTVRQSRMAR